MPPAKSASKQMVAELRSGEPVDAVFLVAECALKTTRTGSPYLVLTLRDRSGQIPGRMWDATESLAKSIAVNDFVRVKGVAETYQGTMQLNVRTLTRTETEGLRMGDFLPHTPKDTAQMLRDLKAILETVQDADLKRLAEAFLSDETFMGDFRAAPAAVQNHHSYLGGLLEHTASMAAMAVKVCEHYADLRRDLLLTGVFLHDIGKTRELNWARSFQYTPGGNLVGHLVIGTMMVEEKARSLKDFPPEKLRMLQHMLLSHHGEYAFGSPKLPMFAEALALHYLDNLDAKLKDFSETISEDKSADPDFTEYSRRLERKLYKG